MAIQLETTDWIFGSMVWWICWPFYPGASTCTIRFLFCWIMLPFHFHFWWHYKGCEQFQHRNNDHRKRHEDHKWTSCWIDKSILLNCTDLYRCKRVRNAKKLSHCDTCLMLKISSILRCVTELNQIYEYSLFAFYAWMMVDLSSLLVTLQFQFVECWIKLLLFEAKFKLKHLKLFFFQKWQNNWNAMEMVISVIMLFHAIVINFLICEHGQWVTNQYAQLHDELDACDWYLLPIELRRLYFIFLLNTEQPVHLQCYVDIRCSRNTFKKVRQLKLFLTSSILCLPYTFSS